MALNIGIDFGTSTIYVTRWNEKRKEAEPIPNITRSSKEQFIENIVYYESENNLILGQKAKTKGIIHPENLVSYIKRHLNEPNWSQWIKSLNRKVTASEVATDIFRFLKKRIEETHSKPIDAVVLSVPFAFGDKERQLIQSCAENAGLNVVQLIEEPISAGISYGFFHDDHAQDFDSQTILMFDLGGGTFDIAIFKLFRFDDQLNIEIIGTDGDKRLGGKDIDDMIFYKFCKQLNIKLSEIDEKLSLRDANDLLNEAKNTKENLSELENLEVMHVLKDFGEVLEWELSQDDLEEWIIEMGFIRRIEDILNSALHNHSVSIDDLDQIILVGGTTNIPLIKRSVKKFFKRPIAILKNPAEMVGEGNGILCGSLNDHQLKFNLSFANQKQKVAKIEENNGIQIKPKKIDLDEQGWQFLQDWHDWLDGQYWQDLDEQDWQSLQDWHDWLDEKYWQDLLNWVNQYLTIWNEQTKTSEKAPELNSVQELKNLTKLDVSYNHLGALPESIGELKNLTELHVGGNQLSALPDWIGELKNLTSLDVSYNYLGALPESIGELKNLTELHIGGNELSALPECIKELKSLTSLHVGGNELTALPEWIGELKNLTSLGVNGFDDWQLDRNQLTVLPEWIRELKNLTKLDVGSNKLTVLPEWLGELKNLTSLHVGGNKLTALPEWIGELKQLTELNVSYNQLTASSIQFLKQLEQNNPKLKIYGI